MGIRALFGLLFFVLGLFAAAFFVYHQLDSWGQERRVIAEEELVEVPRGTSLKKLAETLEEQGLVADARLFRAWVRLFSDYSRFQAGLYRFEHSVSPATIAAVISEGDVYTPVVLEVTIPEGFTLKQIIARLAAKGVASIPALMAVSSNKPFLEANRIDADTMEGYFYPATYSFSKMPNAGEALRRGVETFWKKLPEDYPARVEAMGLTLHEAVIFASLIEHETAHDDERQYVSEVIWNRLNANIALAIDASLIYGIPDYNGNLSRKHLEDTSNLWNTRVHLGLPPTPICSPSLESLLAVLSPSNEGYYYYVLDLSRGNRHQFSKTLAEHNRWVRKLVRDQREQRRRSRRGS